VVTSLEEEEEGVTSLEEGGRTSLEEEEGVTSLEEEGEVKETVGVVTEMVVVVIGESEKGEEAGSLEEEATETVQVVTEMVLVVVGEEEEVGALKEGAKEIV
jgi:hypothetical protein